MLSDRVAGLRLHHLSILREFVYEQKNSDDHSGVSDQLQCLRQIEFLQFFSPSLCTAMHINC